MFGCKSGMCRDVLCDSKIIMFCSTSSNFPVILTRYFLITPFLFLKSGGFHSMMADRDNNSDATRSLGGEDGAKDTITVCYYKLEHDNKKKLLNIQLW